MDLTFYLSDISREYELKSGISFQVQDLRKINNRIVFLFFKKEIPILSAYLDSDTLNSHGFTYKNHSISEQTISTVKEILKKIKNLIVFEPFHHSH